MPARTESCAILDSAWERTANGGKLPKLFDNQPSFRYFCGVQELLLSHGYPALFFLSFCASTLIPLGSEWLLVLMLLNRHDPAATVAIATIGNLLGACTTYWLGLYGGPWLIRRVLRIDAQAENRAKDLYRRFGSWSLLFSWLPIIGDPLCLVGGILRVHFIKFSLLVFAGKLGRYGALAWLTVRGSQLITG